MKLWVTGARGFIGRHVCSAALKNGHEVWAIHRAVPDATNLRPEAPNAPLAGMHDIALELSDRTAVTTLARATAPDAVIHLAWYARPQDYLNALDNADSLASTLAFARAALEGGCKRMVGVGTCVEYATLPRPRREDDPVDPKSLYARCKHAAHLVLEELFARSGASLSWARLFHMHGPGENPARLVPAVAAALRAGRSFPLSPGEQLRDHLDVRDVASALVHLAESDVEGPINVCSGRPVSLRSVLEIIGREVGRSELLAFGQREYQAGEVMNLSGDPARLQASGWQPAHDDLVLSLRESIAAFPQAL
jgi:nucleoside-diphosphate-sugar epimerase